MPKASQGGFCSFLQGLSGHKKRSACFSEVFIGGSEKIFRLRGILPLRKKFSRKKICRIPSVYSHKFEYTTSLIKGGTIMERLFVNYYKYFRLQGGFPAAASSPRASLVGSATPHALLGMLRSLRGTRTAGVRCSMKSAARPNLLRSAGSPRGEWRRLYKCGRREYRRQRGLAPSNSRNFSGAARTKNFVNTIPCAAKFSEPARAIRTLQA